MPLGLMQPFLLSSIPFKASTLFFFFKHKDGHQQLACGNAEILCSVSGWTDLTHKKSWDHKNFFLSSIFCSKGSNKKSPQLRSGAPMIPFHLEPDGSFPFQPSTFPLLDAIKLHDTSNCSLGMGFLTMWLMYHEQYFRPSFVASDFHLFSFIN